MVTPGSPAGAVQMPNSCISGASAAGGQLGGQRAGEGDQLGVEEAFRDVAIERVRVHAVFVDDAGEIVDAHVRIGHE